MKIAFLTSFNADFIKKDFVAFLKKNFIEAETWWNGYGLHEQTIYDLESPLYKFKPDIILIHYEVESVLGDIAYDLLAVSNHEREIRVEEVNHKLRHAIETLCSSLPQSKIVIQNFIARSESYLGVLDTNISTGLSEIILLLNKNLFKLKHEFGERVIIQSFVEVVSKYGKNSVYDLRLYRLAKYPFADSFSKHLCKHYYSAINVFLQPRKKCIVLDLDNTLWGGIVGQDGIENLQLGSSGVGESFMQFQKVLLNFYRRGIFLAVCSKNNYDDAIEVMEKHPDMILRKNYFSSLKINWFDKATNLIAIAKDLNIGIDSLVFLDDNPAECELVHQQLPEVEVINLIGDPDNYITQLMNINSLQDCSLTEEDAARNIIHGADEKRKELEEKFSNLEEYYRSLAMEAFVSVNNVSQTARISQLTQKTNQFNLTTRRYTTEEIKNLISGNSHNIYSLRLVDKFGDNGIVVVAIVTKNKSEWLIDSFLMSCRVIGRQAETALLDVILQDAVKTGIKKIKGQYIPTKKNLPSADFFERHGFTKYSETEWGLQLPAVAKKYFININMDI